MLECYGRTYFMFWFEVLILLWSLLQFNRLFFLLGFNSLFIAVKHIKEAIVETDTYLDSN